MSSSARAAPSGDLWRSLVEGASDGVVVLNAGDLAIHWSNDAFARLLGYERASELDGRRLESLVHPDDREALLPRLRASLGDAAPRPEDAECRLLLRDGTTVAVFAVCVDVRLDGEPAVGLVLRDVSHERRRRARLAQADRMASLGALAAGVAHEINNPLTYVLLRLGAVSAATRKLRALANKLREALEKRFGEVETGALLDGESGAALLEEITGHVETATEGAARVRKIVNDLRVFARNDDEVREPVDLERPLELALGMATHELKHRATVVREYVPLPPAYGSESGLAQVFLNLLLNAAAAIPEGQPVSHRIVLKTGREEDRVYASVTDTGQGIAPEHLSRIFEPFYTSGERPSGGLGLAICHGIVRSLGGSIRVSSRPGEGSTFTVFMPIAPPAALDAAQTSSSGSPRA